MAVTFEIEILEYIEGLYDELYGAPPLGVREGIDEIDRVYESIAQFMDSGDVDLDEKTILLRLRDKLDASIDTMEEIFKEIEDFATAGLHVTQKRMEKLEEDNNERRSSLLDKINELEKRIESLRKELG